MKAIAQVYHNVLEFQKICRIIRSVTLYKEKLSDFYIRIYCENVSAELKKVLDSVLSSLTEGVKYVVDTDDIVY